MDDSDIIGNIINSGIGYLPTILNDNNHSLVKTYVKMFVESPEIFPNGLNKFVDYVFDINFDKRIWNIFVESDIDDKVILTVLSQIFIKSKEIEFHKKCKLISTLLMHDKIHKLLCDDYIWNVGTGHNIENMNILGLIFKGMDITKDTQEEYKNKVLSVHSIFFGLVTDKQLRPFIIKWFANVYNFNLHKKNSAHEMELDENKDESSDTFLLNVLYLLILFWNKGVIDKRDNITLRLTKIDKVNFKYPVNKDCPIRWHKKDDEIEIKTPKFLSELFFLILHGLRVVYIPIITKSISWKLLLDRLEEEKDIIENLGNGVYSQINLMHIYKEIKYVKDSLVIYDLIANMYHLTSTIHTFYEHFLVWVRRKGQLTGAKKQLEYDDILHNLISFEACTFDKYLNNGINSNKEMIKLIMEIAASDTHSKNPEIRSKCSTLLSEYKAAFPHMVDNTLLIESLINFAVTINKFRGDNPIQIFLYKKKAYKNIYKIVKTYSNQKEFDSIMQSNKNIKLKFVMMILSDLIWLGDNITPIIDKLNGGGLSERSKNKNTKFLYELLEYYSVFIDIIYNFVNMSKEFSKLIESDEIVSNVALILNLSYKWITDYIQKQFPALETQARSKMDFVKFGKQITMLINNLKDNKIFVDNIVNDAKVYDIDRFRNNPGLSDFIIAIEEYLKIGSDDIDYPDEFLDPIMLSKIECPMMLPELDNMFVDKKSIMKHLLIDETNPFTRSKLTIDELNEYNDKPEVVNKINSFREKFKKWLNDYKKKETK